MRALFATLLGLVAATALLSLASAAGGGFDSGNIAPNGTFSFQFNDAGTFTYHCNIHPTMKGKIIVTSDSGSGTHPIDIQASSFPDAFTIARGVVVTWTNKDSFDHTVTSDTQGNTAGTAAPGFEVAFAFAALALVAFAMRRAKRA